jgi:uncharacterized protein YecT (DUF1311 family)
MERKTSKLFQRRRSILRTAICVALAPFAICIAGGAGGGPRAERLRQDAGGSPQVDCKSPQTQYEIGVCTSAQYEQADAELRSLYAGIRSKLLSRTSASDGARLENVEKLWLRYRDAECSMVHDSYAGGSDQSAATNDCLERLTKERIADLKDDYEF